MWPHAAQHINRYWIAQMFLTRLPVPKSSRWSEQALAESTAYFPVVGVVIGLLAAAVFHLGQWLWSTEVAAVIAIAAAIIATGAFHEDGLADSADGIGGAFELEKKLAIMRDSRVGTYGSVTLLLVVSAKVFALVTIDPAQVTAALVTAHCVARWTPLPLIACNRYLREDGTGKPFAATVNTQRLLVASGIASVVTLICAQWFAFIVIPCAVAFVLLAQWYLRHKLGGITGDVLGAVNSLTELLIYLLFGISLLD